MEIYIQTHKYEADFRSGIIRKDVCFSRTGNVHPEEYKSVTEGITKMIAEIGRDIACHDYGDARFGDGPYSSPDWYQEQAMTSRERGYGRQADAKTIDRLLRTEPYQRYPHFDVMILDKDLTTNTPENIFIFGYGPYPNNIISVKRFMHWFKDKALRQACLAILGAHEFAHNMDMVKRNYNVGKEGYKIMHCSGELSPCLMEQVNVPGARSIDEQAKLLIGKSNWLCPDCTEEMQVRKDTLTKMGYW